MNINWLVRIKSKTFWLTVIPAILILVQVVLASFGITWEITVLETNLMNIVNAVFGLLAILGVVVDHTTEGISDSDRALTYTEPK